MGSEVFFCAWLPLLSVTFRGSSMLLHVSVLCCFLLMHNIPSYGFTTIPSSALLLMDIWILASLGPLWKKLLRTRVETYFYFFWVNTPRHGISGLCSKYVDLYKKRPDCFLKCLCHFAFPPVLSERSSVPTRLPTLGESRSFACSLIKTNWNSDPTWSVREIPREEPGLMEVLVLY